MQFKVQGEHSAILSTFIKLPSVIKIFVLSIFEWPLKTGLTVSTITATPPHGDYVIMRLNMWFSNEATYFAAS